MLSEKDYENGEEGEDSEPEEKYVKKEGFGFLQIPLQAPPTLSQIAAQSDYGSA